MRTKYIPADIVQRIENMLPYPSNGVWRLCWETGVRVSDAIKVKWIDFDDDGHFRYTAKKTGKKGVALVSQDFLNIYIRHFKTPICRYVFQSPKKKNTHITRQTVWNHIKAACIKADINPEGIAPHSARKFFAVETFHKKGLGATMSSLQHRDVGTTMIYALSDDALHRCIVELRQLRKVVDRLCDAVFGDTRFEVTKAGKKYLESHKSDFDIQD